MVKKAKVFKGNKVHQNKIVRITNVGENGCQCPIAKGNFLVMADESSDGETVAKLILPWKQEKVNIF